MPVTNIEAQLLDQALKAMPASKIEAPTVTATAVTPTAEKPAGPEVKTVTFDPKVGLQVDASKADAPAVETKPAEEPAKPVEESKKPEPSDSKRFVALAKQERRIREREARLKAREAEIENQLREVAPEIEKFQSLKARAKTEPLTAIQEAFGINYDQITEAKISGGTTPDLQIKAVKDELEALKAEQRKAEANRIKADRASLQRQERETVESFYKDAIDEVAASNEYKYTNKYKQQGLVPQLIQEHYRQTKRIMSVAEAGKIVEDYVQGELKAAAEEFQKEAKAPESKPAATASNPRDGANSLSNGMTTSTRPPSQRPMSEAELMKQAIAELDKVQASRTK